MSVVSRWKARKGVRTGLLAAARKRLKTRKTKTNLQVVKKRKAQVAFAERVIERHSNETISTRALHRAELTLAQHVFETGGNNRGPKVEAIINYAHGQVPEPWCVDFVIHSYGLAGSTIVKPGYPRAVRHMLVTGTRVTSNPQPGDIVRYTFDHTGIFVKDNGNGSITVIEGNTGPSGATSDGNGGDGVYRKVRSKSLVADYLRVLA